MMVFDYALSVFSEFKDRALQIAVDLLGDAGEGSGRGLQSLQPLGILARPNDPDVDSDGTPTKGAGVLYGWSGHEGFAIPTTDPRILSKIPELPKGSTVLYACNGSLIYMDGQTGDVTHLVPYKEGSTDKAHAFTFDIANKSVQLRHGDGMGIAITAGGKNSVVINNKAGDAYVEVNDDGAVINGAKVTINGGVLAGDPVTAQGVVLGNDFTAWKAAVDTAIATIAAAAGSMVPAGIVPSAPMTVTPSTKVKASP